MDFKKMNEDVALEGFGAGFDCSQVVLAHCAEKAGISQEEALKVAAAFGGGMWNGETCGCVTGALMALGLKYGHCEPNDEETKNAMVAKKTAFEEAFKKKHETLICKELLGHDISKPAEMEKVMEEDLLTTLCPKLACTACDILDEML